MLRYSRAADASTSLRAHHQRWISEPSSSTASAVVTGIQTTKTSSHQGKQTGAAKTTKVPDRYQKNRSSSTLDRDARGLTASKPSLSSTLQQIGDWARRSFRGYGGGKGAAGRRPKSLNNYVMTEVSSGVVVERKADNLPLTAASRDQSPVTTSSGYASGGDGVYSRLHDEDFEDGEGRHLGRQIKRGASRGSRRYRRRASVHAGTEACQPPATPAEQAVKPPSTAAVTTDKKHHEDRLPVYENLLCEALGLKCETQTDSKPVSPAPCHPSLARRLETSQYGARINTEVEKQLKPTTAEEKVMKTGNKSIDDYLLPMERSSFVSSSDASTLRRTGNGSSPVYVNGNLLMTSVNQSLSWRQDNPARQSRSRSLSSSRNRTLTYDQTSTFNFAGVQQRLSFTPSFVSRSPSPPQPNNIEADWDDRLSTLSLGCHRPPVSPDRRYVAQRPGPRQPRSKSARRRLLFGSHATTLVDRRPEAVEECVQPLFRQTVPPPTISNVATRNPPARRSTGLFPRLADREESIYETIGDNVSRSRLPVSRVHGKGPEVNCDHVYDNIDDLLMEPAPASVDIHQLPPPLPPPPLPARRPTAGNEVPLCRSEVVELGSQHVYTIADVLDSFEALAAHLPRAQRFIYDLQDAAYLHRRRQVTGEHNTECDRGRRAAKDAEGRWTAAAAKSQGSANSKWRSGTADKSSTWRSGPAQRRTGHSAAMYSSDESQPIVVEDYVCSPGNHLSAERPRPAADRTSTDAATATNPTHGDGLYIAMKAGSKPLASTISCCGSRGSAALDGRPLLTAADAARKHKQPTNRTGKETSQMPSRCTAERDGCDVVGDRDNVGEGRRTSKRFQLPSSFIDARSYMLTNSELPADVAQHQRALSRSLMDGISHQPSRRTSGNFADRKQNSRTTSSTFTVDTAIGRSSILSTHDIATRRPYCSPRSASEDRQTGTGNSSRVTSQIAVGDGRRPNNKSSHRSRAADRTTVLSKSLAASTVRHHPTSSGAPASSSSSSTFFHELPPQCDRRRSSILQWSDASCSGREIFC